MPIVVLTPRGVDAESFKREAQVVLGKLNFSGNRIKRIQLLCAPEPQDPVEHFKNCVDKAKKYMNDKKFYPRAFAYLCSRQFFSNNSKQLAQILQERDAEMKKTADVLDLIVDPEREKIVGAMVTYPTPYYFLVQQGSETSRQGVLQPARRVVYSSEAWWSGVRYSKDAITPEAILPGIQEAIDVESARVA